MTVLRHEETEGEGEREWHELSLATRQVTPSSSSRQMGGDGCGSDGGEKKGPKRPSATATGESTKAICLRQFVDYH